MGIVSFEPLYCISQWSMHIVNCDLKYKMNSQIESQVFVIWVLPLVGNQGWTSYGSSRHFQQCKEHLGVTQRPVVSLTDVWCLAHGDKFVSCKTWFSLKWTLGLRMNTFYQELFFFCMLMSQNTLHEWLPAKWLW